MLLKDCFVGCMPPEWAENILIKRTPGSYIVRQSDRDPDELLLSYVSPRGIKHVIVPEFQDSVFIKSKRIKKRLNDESIGVEKFLKSFDCKDPVHLDYEAQPSSFKKKTGPEDGALHRCSVCKYENEDLIKWGWPEDVWFHVDKLSSAHVYLRLAEVMTIDSHDANLYSSLTDCHYFRCRAKP